MYRKEAEKSVYDHETVKQNIPLLLVRIKRLTQKVAFSKRVRDINVRLVRFFRKKRIFVFLLNELGQWDFSMAIANISLHLNMKRKLN